MSDPQTPSPPAGLAGCAFAVQGDEVVVPPSAFTLAGFRVWARSPDFPRRGRIAFLGRQVFIDMSPEEINTHALVKSAVCNAVYNLNEKEKLGVVLPDRVLITNEDANLSNEPDGSFVSWASLEEGLARLVPRGDAEDRFTEVEGAPDWVLEIVSDTSVRKDTQTLREAYHRAGIAEYWLIDARGEEIDFQLLQRGQDGYVAAEVRRGWQRSEVFGRHFRLERRRGPLDLWRYSLRMKAAR